MLAHVNILNPKVIDDLIRLGAQGDGGYVVSRDQVLSADALISFGVCDDWTFEKDFVKYNSNIVIHAYDHTAGSRFIAKKILNEIIKIFSFEFSFSKLTKSIYLLFDYICFFSGNHRHFKERVFNRKDNENDATVEKIIARLSTSNRLVLKMDIEGGEYRVVSQLLKYESKIDLMVIEFHDTDPFRQLFLDKIAEILNFYEIIHLHANNFSGIAADGLPETLEITFLNKRYPVTKSFRNKLPLSLDLPCNSLKPDYELIFSD